MDVRKTCEAPSCGREFDAKRAAARFCSDACRKRNQRRPDKPAKVVALVPPVADDAGDEAPGPVYRRQGMPSAFDATLRQLEDAGRLDTALGIAALIAAQRLDDVLNSADTGSGVAALLKAHRESLAEAVKDAKSEADPLDKIRAAAALKLVVTEGRSA